MVLTRQKLPAVRTTGGHLAAKGAYELCSSNGEALVSIFASGSEVSLAVAAHKILMDKGIGARVISTPCWAAFDQQDAAYQAKILGKSRVNIAVEAAVKLGWEKFIGRDGIFIGMEGFGASAPQDVLYKEFGITSEAIVTAALKALG
jgi:transketolase